jgi:hypothetical protein
MSVTTVTLRQGSKGEKEWRVEITTKHAATASLGTTIDVSTPTELVVREVRKMFPGATIKGPENQTLYPKPPDGYPKIHSTQP